MTDDNRKILEKLRRLDKLARSAGSPGERKAAEAARKRLVERLEKDGVHVAPELIAEVGAATQTQPLPTMSDGPTTEFEESLAHQALQPPHSARTVVAQPVEVEAFSVPAAGLSEVPSLFADAEREPEPTRVVEAAPVSGPTRKPIPGAEPTPMGAVPDEIIIRAPVVAIEGEWTEAEATPDAVTVPTALIDTSDLQPSSPSVASADPFAERTPFYPTLDVPRTPPVGVAVERPSGLRRAPRGKVQSTPPYGMPRPSRPPQKPAASPPPTPDRSWNWKTVVLLVLGAAMLLEVAAYFFAPEVPGGSLGVPDSQAQAVDRTSRACLRGTQAACEDLGTSLIRSGLGQDAPDGSVQARCAQGDSHACEDLGRWFAAEAKRRRQGRSRAPIRGPDPFQRAACALGDASCLQ